MRTIFFFLILSLSLVARSKISDFYSQRGFQVSKCYQNYSTLECNQKCTQCALSLFPNSKGHISIQVLNYKEYCPKKFMKSGSAFYQLLETENKLYTKLFAFIQLPEKVVLSWSDHNGYKVKAVDCPIKD